MTNTWRCMFPTASRSADLRCWLAPPALCRPSHHRPSSQSKWRNTCTHNEIGLGIEDTHPPVQQHRMLADTSSQGGYVHNPAPGRKHFVKHPYATRATWRTLPTTHQPLPHLALALVISRQPVPQTHCCATLPARVGVDARQLLLAARHRAARLLMHPGVVAGVTLCLAMPAAQTLLSLPTACCRLTVKHLQPDVMVDTCRSYGMKPWPCLPVKGCIGVVTRLHLHRTSAPTSGALTGRRKEACTCNMWP